MGASSVQEVAEVEKGVSRCQELEKSLQEETHAQDYVFILTGSVYIINHEYAM